MNDYFRANNKFVFYIKLLLRNDRFVAWLGWKDDMAKYYK